MTSITPVSRSTIGAPPPTRAQAFAFRLAILYPGDRAARDLADPAESRFLPLFEAFAAADVQVEPAVYRDDFRDEVRYQLEHVQGVLVWHNPIEGGRDRTFLDAMLREVASSGVFVSTHPDTILKLGTKDVLLAVRDLPFGSDVHRIDTLVQLKTELPARLQDGARVLKQRRGHSGVGVWRIEKLDAEHFGMQQASRNALFNTVDIQGLLRCLAPYFANGGFMIDQAWQPRVAEGMTRAYLVGDRVAGFGHQAAVALRGAGQAGEVSPPGPRLYSDASDPRFQDLRRSLEHEWVPLLCQRTGTSADQLPLLWDADFLLGARNNGVTERYVLCEINVSSVSPFPDSAVHLLVDATCGAIRSRTK